MSDETPRPDEVPPDTDVAADAAQPSGPDYTTLPATESPIPSASNEVQAGVAAVARHGEAERRPGRAARLFRRYLAALWLGSGAFLAFVAAPAAFSASDTPTNAANVVGALLTRWHYIGLLLPLLLLVSSWGKARTRAVSLLAAAIILIGIEAGIDLRIRSIRESSIVPISSLSPADPVRRHFGMLHGISMVLLVAQIGVAGGVVAIDRIIDED